MQSRKQKAESRNGSEPPYVCSYKQPKGISRMIRPLRQRHRVMISALGVLLPVAFAVGIAARRPIPVASVPRDLGGKAKDFAQVVWTKPDLWPGHDIITTL